MKRKLTAAIISVLMAISTIVTMPIMVSAETQPNFGAYDVISKTEVPQGYIGIYTKGDLDAVRNNLAGKYILMNDIVFSESDFLEDGDYYNNGEGWQPIGKDNTTPFEGTLDGNGYAIKGLSIHIDGIKMIYAGLFGFSKGNILNLGMIDSIIYVEVYPSYSESAFKSTVYAGGIAGYLCGTIENCYNTGSVTAIAAETEKTKPYGAGLLSCAGGIAGVGGANLTVSNCYNSGVVFSSAAAIAEGTHVTSHAGGLFGSQLECTISESYNIGVVYAYSDKLNANEFSYTGGIAGRSMGSAVSFCYNRGVVYGNNYTGGITGFSVSDRISNCYNDSTVVSVADMATGGYSGGITGENGSEIVNCCNSGNIGAVSYFSEAYAGGIAGSMYSGSIINAYNTSEINSISSQSNAYAGGIAGITNSGNLTCCYNNSNIIVEANLMRMGNIIGINYNASMASCYYIANEISGVGQGTDNSNVISVSSKSLSSSYAGFDFNAGWIIPSGYTPCLKTLYTPVEKIDFKQSVVMINKGDYLNIAAQLSPMNGFADLSYTSSNPNVVNIVESGDMVGGSLGSTIITVKDSISGKTASCTVKVINPLQGVCFQNKVLYIKPEQVKRLNLQMTPSNSGGDFLWESDNPSISVDQNGNVVAVSIGVATITATDKISGLTASCKVYVVNAIPGDMNSDNVLDLKDVTLLSRLVAGWTGLNCDETVANVNGDAETDLKDTTLLSRFVAGWDVELMLPA